MFYRLTGLISLLFKGFSGVFSNSSFFSTQPSLWPNSQIHTEKTIALTCDSLYNLSRDRSLWIYALGNLWSFLDVRINPFHQICKICAISSNIHSAPFFSLWNLPLCKYEYPWGCPTDFWDSSFLFSLLFHLSNYTIHWTLFNINVFYAVEYKFHIWSEMLSQSVQKYLHRSLVKLLHF